jgi:hypothetical protein
VRPQIAPRYPWTGEHPPSDIVGARSRRGHVRWLDDPFVQPRARTELVSEQIG